jgi:hypothetical protein
MVDKIPLEDSHMETEKTCPDCQGKMILMPG